MIEANNISVTYPGSKKGIADVTFTVEDGEIMGVLGQNGAGKSTLVRTLSGYIHPTAGWFRVGEYDSRKEGDRVGAHAGVLFETSSYFEELSGRENFEFTAKIYGMQKIENGELHDLFLRDALDVAMKQYSFGMKRKVGLAEILARRPKALILDEPFTGLDYASKYVLQEKLRELARDGSAILLTTNEIAEAEAVCDTVMFVKNGAATKTGRVQELLREVSDVQQIDMHLKNFIDSKVVKGVTGVRSVSFENGRMRVVTEREALPAIIQAVVEAGGSICDIRIKEASLADVFLEKMGIHLQ